MLELNASILVIFLLVWILHFVLSRIFFKPVRKVLEERDARLAENRELTEKALQETEQKIHEVEQGLKSAKSASHMVREELAREALKEKGRLLEELQKDSRARLEKARGELDAQVESSRKLLESEAEALAGRIEQRLLHS